MTITERDWERLEADQHATGMTVRRIYPGSAYDIFIAVRHPGNCRMLTLRVPERDADEALRQLRALPSTRGLDDGARAPARRRQRAAGRAHRRRPPGGVQPARRRHRRSRARST